MNDPATDQHRHGWRIGVLKEGPEATPLVVKFGGSLLRRDDWPDLLRSLVEPIRSRCVAVVVGGGAVVDSIRRLDAAVVFEPAVSHRLAIDAMGITARLVAGSIGWPLSADIPTTTSPGVIDVPSWLDKAGRFDRLPTGWHVTSDSIAAFIAAETSGNLLMAKSAAPPDTAMHPDPVAASALTGWGDGWVDGWFPSAAARVARIDWAAPL